MREVLKDYFIIQEVSSEPSQFEFQFWRLRDRPFLIPQACVEREAGLK
jgi:hypothetical protein